ncbi:DUF3127 domain-containing protein [Bacteroidales bacterium OttesenSCG-928-B11]|nr:DUF3127 domain-containing protein [Bacteroidales bacterium OttesenSCG-928-E04]MDL2308569.1 DUF3127 domain-containing protein [Bacteroidales bacterium OttesenSCG-928-C03]MDL2312857.1 DUF3127 domain-containing protein [Bacteroidales bacterium OttesenSCG-928-B11]MDL2325859.1 DUF3127 domain-containing protein [Bacteroidales bacterium OttesenSCG-928-A14]
MALEITGRIIQKLELQSGISKSGSSWQKQEFVIETMEQYPKKICANLWGDKIDALAAVQIGDTVVVSFNLESREFNGKWYTDVKAWKIEKQGVQPETLSAAPSPTSEMPPFDSSTFVDEGSGNDLPF